MKIQNLFLSIGLLAFHACNDFFLFVDARVDARHLAKLHHKACTSASTLSGQSWTSRKNLMPMAPLRSFNNLPSTKNHLELDEIDTPHYASNILSETLKSDLNYATSRHDNNFLVVTGWRLLPKRRGVLLSIFRRNESLSESSDHGIGLSQLRGGATSNSDDVTFKDENTHRDGGLEKGQISETVSETNSDGKSVNAGESDNGRNKHKNNNSKMKNGDDDEERYSRQVYALGARAHGLVRSTTAILDGPLGGNKERRWGTAKIGEDVSVKGADGFDGVESQVDSNESKGRIKSNGEEVPSGLLYEMSKNLALSGVGRIILVRDDENASGVGDEGYFDGSLDDLGAAYRRAALAEIANSIQVRNDKENDFEKEDVENEDYDDEQELWNDGAFLLQEYIQRLNPGVQVDIISRSKLFHLLRDGNDGVHDEGNVDDVDNDEGEGLSLGANPVVVCIDRSLSAQLEMNDACRQFSMSSPSMDHSKACVPFISVESAGVHARIFCDFGPAFVVEDEDGETSRSTLLDRIEGDDEAEQRNNDDVDNGKEQLLIAHCLEGEHHDVSKGDVIEFQGYHNEGDFSGFRFPKCEVVKVRSPVCFTIRKWDGDSTEKNDDGLMDSLQTLEELLQGRARSFSRLKKPKTLSFSSLREILFSPSDDELHENKKAHTCWENDSIFAPSDLDKSFDPLRRRALMSSMEAMDRFVKKYGRLPLDPSKMHVDEIENESKHKKRSDIERFLSLARKVEAGNSEVSNKRKWENLVSQFARTCRAKFTPIQAFAGALGAQEVLKAATGLYNPIRQFLLYDCDEVLQDANDIVIDSTGEKNKDENFPLAKGQSYLLGADMSRKLSSSRLFLVGAGAIGCELLKNLAAMGAGCGNSNRQGCIILTDMDTIERSNLSRQLLFRDHDVGEFKSVAARAAVLRFLSNCRIESHTSRVGEEEDGPFDDGFWSSGCDVVLNALDNVEARLYVDSQCVAHGLGLIDAGTLGPKGNVQVVVPHESESYGSSADPPEPDIPVCTLKNFPYEISHTIQWARDLFDGYFHRRPRQANDHVEELSQSSDLSHFAHSMIHKLGEDAALDMAEELGEDLGVFPFVVGEYDKSDSEYVDAVKKSSIHWAIQQAQLLFFDSMEELLQKHPGDSVDDDGVPFWTGTRHIPKALKFNTLSDEDEVSAQQVIINERIAQFVRSAARLRIETFLPSSVKDAGVDTSSLVSLEDVLSALEENVSSKSKKVSHNSADIDENDGNTKCTVLEKLNGAKTGATLLPRLRLADFEKDEESNGHVAFITAASNLRAMAYGIPPADAMETRRIAGRIVPAMITTTGLVSALSCLELIKLLKNLPVNTHRNAFVNLALPFFAFTTPMPAEEILSVNGKTHTIWDRISIKASSKSPVEGLTMKNFLGKIKKKASCGDDVEIASISYGPFMLYANFLHSEDEELLSAPLMDTIRDAIISGDEDVEMQVEEEVTAEKKDPVGLSDEQKKELSKLERKRFIDFSVTVENLETGEEFELPTVRLVKERMHGAEKTCSTTDP